MIGLANSAMNLANNFIDTFFESKEEKRAAKLKLLEMEQDGKLKEMQINMSAIIAEAQSKDPYTSRARPTFLYVMYALFGLCMVGSILGIWFPIEVFRASENMSLLFNALPGELYLLFGSGYLGYGYLRSKDKENDVESMLKKFR